MDLTPLPSKTVNMSMDQHVSAPQEASPEIKENSDKLSYDELFPALPNAGAAPATVRDSSPVTQWSTNFDMRIASSVVTQVFHIPPEERAKIDDNNQFGESDSSRLCAQIAAKTGANIEISMAKDLSLTFVITGKNSEVAEAKKAVTVKFQTQARQIVRIPREHHKIILGKKGKRLQELEVTTGTRISMPSADSMGDEVTVMGSKEGIEKAVHELKVISDEQSKQAYEKFDVPRMYHPFICGPNNETVNKMMNDYPNVRVNLPPFSMDKTEITIAGEKEGVMKVKEKILNIYAEMEKTCKTVSVEVTKEQHRFVIGNKGANLAEILSKTGVSVEMPTSESNSETITLRGPSHKLGEALTLLYTKANSVVTKLIQAPTWTHKFLIGKKGSNIKQIMQDYDKVHVEFTGSNIKLEGPPEEVEFIAEKLISACKDIEERFLIDELTVDPRYFKFIIGKNGSNINRIRNETGTNLQMLEEQGKNRIIIEGTKEGVSSAKQELSEMISKMENEKEREISIDQRFHRTLIGQKGETIREIRDMFNQVQISFPGTGEQSDVVKIRGHKDDVDKCYRHLTKMVQDMKESNFVLKVAIYRQLHKFIIGKGGSTINKIREETNTRIDLPSEGASSDEIVIYGKKADCKRAEEKILKIQDEYANVVELDIMVPAKFHNSMIGAGGKLIQSVSEECGNVRIRFPPPESKSDKVSIRGIKEDVLKAKEILIDMSNEKQLSGFTEEIKAKPQLHKFLIGRNGANIRKIRTSTGAHISLPTEKDERQDVITIMGKKESVLKAKEQLQTIIKDLENVVEITTSVDPKHHRHFVARRCEVLHQISDEFGGVTISFPRQGIVSDKVAVKGSKDCVDGAVARIQAIASDLEERVTLEVDIPQKHHRTIMGARGSKVKEVSADFDVSIKFPDKDLDPQNMVNGDSNGIRPQDNVVIQGRKENCEKARDALVALIPVTEEIVVPFKHHRYIIGVKGDNVRAMSSEFDVQVRVPPVHEQRDIITITGPQSNVQRAKQALLDKVQDFEAEEEDRLARNFQIQLNIDPDYHPRIIGKKGAVISKIRDKFQVNIQFPPKGSQDRDLITIVGYEKNCYEAKSAILEITGDLENMVSDTIEIEPSIHSRLIGTRGRSIRKIMDDYKVEVKFPRGDDNPRSVTIVGAEENVEECKDHLLSLAEEFMQDMDEMEDMKRYISYSGENDNQARNGRNVDDHGFVVAGAPWSQHAPKIDSSEDFPSMGSVSTPSMAPAWGPKRA